MSQNNNASQCSVRGKSLAEIDLTLEYHQRTVDMLVEALNRYKDSQEKIFKEITELKSLHQLSSKDLVALKEGKVDKIDLLQISHELKSLNDLIDRHMSDSLGNHELLDELRRFSSNELTRSFLTPDNIQRLNRLVSDLDKTSKFKTALIATLIPTVITIGGNFLLKYLFP